MRLDSQTSRETEEEESDDTPSTNQGSKSNTGKDMGDNGRIQLLMFADDDKMEEEKKESQAPTI